MKTSRAKRRIMGIALALAMTLCILPMSTQEVNADGVSTIKYAKKITISTRTVSDAFFLDMRNKEKDIQECVIVSNNERVAKGNRSLVEVKRPGTATLSIKVTTSSGEVKRYKTKLKIVRYSNAFKSFKIGKKQLKGKFAKNRMLYFDPGKLKNGKVVIVPAKNWKVKSIKFESYYGDEWGKPVPPVKKDRLKGTVKNNKMLRLKQGKYWHHRITVTMYNKKTGLNEPYQIAYNAKLWLLRL